MTKTAAKCFKEDLWFLAILAVIAIGSAILGWHLFRVDGWLHWFGVFFLLMSAAHSIWCTSPLYCMYLDLKR